MASIAQLAKLLQAAAVIADLSNLWSAEREMWLCAFLYRVSPNKRGIGIA
jgi:hypothetical protein